jgi:hypothetical protein
VKKSNGGTTGRGSYSFKGLPWLREGSFPAPEKAIVLEVRKTTIPKTLELTPEEKEFLSKLNDLDSVLIREVLRPLSTLRKENDISVPGE